MSTSSNQPFVPNAREALNKFKMEAASRSRRQPEAGL